MKKIRSITGMTLAFALLCAGALASPAAEDIIGTWYCNAVKAGDFVMGTALWGTDMTWTFSADNTALRQKTGEDDREGTWAIEGGQIIAKVGVTPEMFTFVDNALVTEGFGLKVIYGREKKEENPVELPALRDGASLEDFDGFWNAVAIHLEGITAPLALAGIFEATLAIDRGKVTFSVASSTCTQDEYAGALDGGALIATAQNETQQKIDTLTLLLHEDGTLRMVLSEDFFMFFQKAE